MVCIQDFRKLTHILVLGIMVYDISNHILVHHKQLHILVLEPFFLIKIINFYQYFKELMH
jgi:hypothetical protein